MLSIILLLLNYIIIHKENNIGTYLFVFIPKLHNIILVEYFLEE